MVPAWPVQYTRGYSTLLFYLREEMASERLSNIPGHQPWMHSLLWNKMHTDFSYSVQRSYTSQHLFYLCCATSSDFYMLLCLHQCSTPNSYISLTVLVPWSWSYSLLWAARGCWESNSCPLKEQKLFLSSPSLWPPHLIILHLPHDNDFIKESCRDRGHTFQFITSSNHSKWHFVQGQIFMEWINTFIMVTSIKQSKQNHTQNYQKSWLPFFKKSY